MYKQTAPIIRTSIVLNENGCNRSFTVRNRNLLKLYRNKATAEPIADPSKPYRGIKI